MSHVRHIKLPRTRTAAMQLMQQFAASGHVHYLCGTITREKLRRFLAKLALFDIYRDAPGRAYDRKRGKASVHLVVVALDAQTAFWCLLSTPGRRGLADPAASDLGKVRDTRLRGEHLPFLGYELLRQEKRIEGVAGSTWTWRLTRQRYDELEAHAVQVARERDLNALETLVVRQSAMPLFSGVRGQVLKLNALARKLASKFGRGEVALPQLPYMVRLPFYGDPPDTVEGWAGSTPDGAPRASAAHADAEACCSCRRP